MAEPIMLPDWASESINLAQPRLGAKVISATDDFFADKSRLIAPDAPVFKEGLYDDNGKWMDGWESRRKRSVGSDHCIVALGQPAIISGFEIDTSHFTGNYAKAAAIDVCKLEADEKIETAEWHSLVAPIPLVGDSRHFQRTSSDQPWTHIRLHAIPDGGIARLRVYGRILKDWQSQPTGQLVDLAAMENGGRAVAQSDAHFGELANLIAPGSGVNMGDGWETRRRREPGFDWGIIKLGTAGKIQRLEIDTAHFKGNFAFKVAIYGTLLGDMPNMALPSLAIYWPALLKPVELSADNVHEFAAELVDIGPVDHLRIDMIPDGGISRVRAWGIPKA